MTHPITEFHLRQMIAQTEAVDRRLRAIARHLYLLLAVMWLSGFALGVVVGKLWWQR